MSYALSLLARDRHDIPTALYLTYMAYRERFIEERGLMDSPPGVDGWKEALAEARTLERAVNQAWTKALLATFSPQHDSRQTADPHEEVQECSDRS